MGRPTESTGAANSLTIRDNRTGKVYDVPCVSHRQPVVRH